MERTDRIFRQIRKYKLKGNRNVGKHEVRTDSTGTGNNPTP